MMTFWTHTHTHTPEAASSSAALLSALEMKALLRISGNTGAEFGGYSCIGGVSAWRGGREGGRERDRERDNL